MENWGQHSQGAFLEMLIESASWSPLILVVPECQSEW